eukprot:scaffold325500_cov117-Tisochrysis_lutea.AAC.1
MNGDPTRSDAHQERESTYAELPCLAITPAARSEPDACKVERPLTHASANRAVFNLCSVQALEQ